MEILRFLTRPLSSRASRGDAILGSIDSRGDNQLDCFGCEWIEVDEPVGIFLPQLKRRRQLLQLDQVHHVLHYDNYRRFMRVQDITLVTAVEEIDDDGKFQWWMSIQDASTVQVWIIHFPSLLRLESWVSILRTVTTAARTRCLIGDVVLASASSPPNIKTATSSDLKETVVQLAPEQ